MSMPGMGDAQTSSAPVATAPMSVEKLGDVNFAVSCKPSTQAQFNRGIALLHSFGYTQAERQFKSIVAADPTCAMEMCIRDRTWTGRRGRREAAGKGPPLPTGRGSLGS